ncbi:hypothetical protein HMPREF1548_00287 [Clostridium sp. KLE 1755]|nr:hypothetical protein HMPREF1548_00287 [Clostridium sp. KLE 1755]
MLKRGFLRRQIKNEKKEIAALKWQKRPNYDRIFLTKEIT